MLLQQLLASVPLAAISLSQGKVAVCVFKKWLLVHLLGIWRRRATEKERKRKPSVTELWFGIFCPAFFPPFSPLVVLFSFFPSLCVRPGGDNIKGLHLEHCLLFECFEERWPFVYARVCVWVCACVRECFFLPAKRGHLHLLDVRWGGRRGFSTQHSKARMVFSSSLGPLPYIPGDFQDAVSLDRFHLKAFNFGKA